MSHPDLGPVQAALEAIPLGNIKAPDMPVSEALSEGEALLAFLGSPKGEAAKGKLLAVGVAADLLLRLRLALTGLRAAQALSQSKGRRTKTDTQTDAEAAAYTLRGNIMSACRWNLRDDRVAQGALDLIAEGEGVPDLLTDLGALATLITDNADAFAPDTTFDPAERAEACRESVARVSAHLSDPENKIAASDALDLRDRAWTHYTTLHRELRKAANHALRHDPHSLGFFFSTYHRKRGQKHRVAKHHTNAAQ